MARNHRADLASGEAFIPGYGLKWRLLLIDSVAGKEEAKSV